MRGLSKSEWDLVRNLFLGLLVFAERSEELDLSPSALGRDRLRVGLEQVDGFARFLYNINRTIRHLEKTRNLHERYGICFSCSSQYSDIWMLCRFMSSPAEVMRCSLAWFMTYSK